MSKEPLTIRPVANGFIVTTTPHWAIESGQSTRAHVFTDPAALGKWVAEYYGAAPVSISGSMPVPKEEAAKCEQDPEHNPDNLSDEQIGRRDGWRLLRKSELKRLDGKRPSGVQYWPMRGCAWENESNSVPVFEDIGAFRTKLTPEELAKLP